MAAVTDRPPVKAPAVTVPLSELTQGHSLRVGKDKTLSLGEMRFSTISDQRKQLSSQYRLCNKKLFLKHTQVGIKQFGQPYGHGLRQNRRDPGAGRN